MHHLDLFSMQPVSLIRLLDFEVFCGFIYQEFTVPVSNKWVFTFSKHFPAQSDPIWMVFISNWFDTGATLGLHNSNLFFTVIFYNQVYLCHHVALKHS